MTTLDWHGERAGLADLRMLDRCAVPEGIDMAVVRCYRLDRVRAEMALRDIAACLLFDPVNIRYATGREGVKLEQQLLITGTGAELLSNFPFEETLLTG